LWKSESFDTSPGNIEGVGQGVDSLAGVVFSDGRQVGISGGSQDADMSQDLLEFDKIYAGRGTNLSLFPLASRM